MRLVLVLVVLIILVVLLLVVLALVLVVFFILILRIGFMFQRQFQIVPGILVRCIEQQRLFITFYRLVILALPVVGVASVIE